MKRLIAALCLWSSAALAQDITPAQCRASVEPLEDALGVSIPSPTVDALGRCTSLAAVFFENETMSLRADRVYWRLAEVERWTEDRLPPTWIELSAEGIWPENKTGDAVLDYLLNVQNKRTGIFAELVLDWDEDTEELAFEAAFLDFGPLGHIEASAKLIGTNLSDQSSIQLSALTAALSEFDLKIETTGLFESYALVPLGTLVLRGEADPARAAAIIKSHRIDDIREFDRPSIDQPSKDALVALVEEMPNPNGVFDLSLRANEGLDLLLLGSTFFGNRFGDVPELLSVFDSSDITFNWTSLSKP